MIILRMSENMFTSRVLGVRRAGGWRGMLPPGQGVISAPGSSWWSKTTFKIIIFNIFFGNATVFLGFFIFFSNETGFPI